MNKTFKVKDSDILINVSSPKRLSNKDIRSYLMQLAKSDQLKDPEYEIPESVFMYTWSDNTIAEVMVTMNDDDSVKVGHLLFRSVDDFLKVISSPEVVTVAEDSSHYLGRLFVRKYTFGLTKENLISSVRSLIGNEDH